MTRAKPKAKAYIHPKALCESKRVGKGTRIWAFTHVAKGAVIGEDCNLGEGVYVEDGVTVGNRCTIKNGIALWHSVHLEDDVFLGPNVALMNDLTPRAFLKRGPESFDPTFLRRGASVGANATLVCGVTIGEFALIGAGAVVTKDVAPHALVVGNPGRQVGLVCFCGARLDKKLYCPECRLTLADNSLETVFRGGHRRDERRGNTQT